MWRSRQYGIFSVNKILVIPQTIRPIKAKLLTKVATEFARTEAMTQIVFMFLCVVQCSSGQCLSDAHTASTAVNTEHAGIKRCFAIRICREHVKLTVNIVQKRLLYLCIFIEFRMFRFRILHIRNIISMKFGKGILCFSITFLEIFPLINTPRIFPLELSALKEKPNFKRRIAYCSSALQSVICKHTFTGASYFHETMCLNLEIYVF